MSFLPSKEAVSHKLINDIRDNFLYWIKFNVGRGFFDREFHLWHDRRAYGSNKTKIVYGLAPKKLYEVFQVVNVMYDKIWEVIYKAL